MSNPHETQTTGDILRSPEGAGLSRQEAHEYIELRRISRNASANENAASGADWHQRYEASGELAEAAYAEMYYCAALSQAEDSGKGRILPVRHLKANVLLDRAILRTRRDDAAEDVISEARLDTERAKRLARFALVPSRRRGRAEIHQRAEGLLDRLEHMPGATLIDQNLQDTAIRAGAWALGQSTVVLSHLEPLTEVTKPRLTLPPADGDLELWQEDTRVQAWNLDDTLVVPSLI